MKTALAVCILVISSQPCALASGLIAYPQSGNTITGFIFDTSRRPVAGARVELLDEVDSLIAGTQTSSSGLYAFNNLPPGTFQVRVLPLANYLGQTARVTIANFRLNGARASGAQREQVDFTLTARQEARASGKQSIAGFAFAQSVPETARLIYEKAIGSLDKKNDSEHGIADLRKAIELFPPYYLALERLGVEYVKRQQHEMALTVLSKAVEINSSGHISFYALGVAQFNLNRMDEAIKSLKRAILLAPDSPNAGFFHAYIGIALVKVGNNIEAESHLRQAHELGAKHMPDVHFHLAQIYSNNKRYAEAADELVIVLKEMTDARDAEKIRALVKQLRDKAKKNSVAQ